MTRHARILACCLAAALAACAAEPVDAGTPDAGTAADAGTPPVDAGTPDAGTPKAPPGSACEGDDDCVGPNATCLDTLPNGYCIKDCTLASQCPSGTQCLSTGAGGKCVAACTSDDDCRKSEGYYCEKDGNFCYSATYVPTNPGGKQIGEACAKPDECEGAVCLPETTENGFKTGYTGGYCLASCVAGHPESCPSGSSCLNGYCRKSCSQASDCRGAPYACVDGTCRLDPATVTVGTACTKTAECAAGAICITESESLGAFPGGSCAFPDDCDAAKGTGCGPAGSCVAIHDLYGDGATVGACLPSCDPAQADACRPGYACDATKKTCLARPADPTKVKLGEACTTDADCDKEPGAGGHCATGNAYPGGYCLAAGCTRGGGDAGSATDTCTPAGGSCWAVPGGATPYSYCIKSCTEASQCRGNGYTCDSDKTCWYYPPE